MHKDEALGGGLKNMEGGGYVGFGRVSWDEVDGAEEGGVIHPHDDDAVVGGDGDDGEEGG
jgi:hypothetical protein